MKTEAELNKEIDANDIIRKELNNQLYQIRQNNENDKLKSYQYLVGKCFESVKYSDRYYKIVAVRKFCIDTIICDTVNCTTSEIFNTIYFDHHLNDITESIEIPLKQFNAKLNQTFQIILKK